MKIKDIVYIDSKGNSFDKCEGIILNIVGDIISVKIVGIGNITKVDIKSVEFHKCEVKKFKPNTSC